jgi:hypothetical protein
LPPLKLGITKRAPPFDDPAGTVVGWVKPGDSNSTKPQPAFGGAFEVTVTTEPTGPALGLTNKLGAEAALAAFDHPVAATIEPITATTIRLPTKRRFIIASLLNTRTHAYEGADSSAISSSVKNEQARAVRPPLLIHAPRLGKVPIGFSVGPESGRLAGPTLEGIIGRRASRSLVSSHDGLVSSDIRQFLGEELHGWFEPVLCLDSCVLARLQAVGITFTELTEGDMPGPTEWAAVELDDGSQRVLEHPSSGEPEGSFLYVRGQVQETPIGPVAQQFIDWLQPTSGEVDYVYEWWPPGYER